MTMKKTMRTLAAAFLAWPVAASAQSSGRDKPVLLLLEKLGGDAGQGKGPAVLVSEIDKVAVHVPTDRREAGGPARTTEERLPINAEASAWADRNIQGLTDVPAEKRTAVYYAVSLFYGRLTAWRSFRPFYDGLYRDAALARKYPFFAEGLDGLFLVILRDGRKLTELAPYRRAAGMTVEQVFGFVGDGRPMDTLNAESSRQSLVISEADLTTQPIGAFNLFYHEFAHLLHLTLLTPAEFGRLDELYAAAKARGAFLDDYAAHNASEYFGQGLEAYLSETKPEADKYRKHTREDLRRQDPALLEFIEGLKGS